MTKIYSIPMRGNPKTGDTKILQTALTAHGYDTKGIDDGFGENTQKAVEAFLKDNKMNTGGIISLPMLKNWVLNLFPLSGQMVMLLYHGSIITRKEKHGPGLL
ncbi:MAG: putative peptidoglycan binding domain [Bacteroidota bacterium]|jgi:peptidoglycan hydrolase-like protein with peptidoglycan-binding domain